MRRSASTALRGRVTGSRTISVRRTSAPNFVAHSERAKPSAKDSEKQYGSCSHSVFDGVRHFLVQSRISLRRGMPATVTFLLATPL
eukprot:3744808-Prymnesium_polylepis.2